MIFFGFKGTSKTPAVEVPLMARRQTPGAAAFQPIEAVRVLSFLGRVREKGCRLMKMLRCSQHFQIVSVFFGNVLGTF